jgi:hypothetical protein
MPEAEVAHTDPSSRTLLLGNRGPGGIHGGE